MTWRILAAMRSAASKISCSPRCWSAKSPWAIRRTTRGSLSSNRSRQASRTDVKVRGRKYATASGRRELKTRRAINARVGSQLLPLPRDFLRKCGGNDSKSVAYEFRTKSAQSGGLETNGPRERISGLGRRFAVWRFTREARGYWRFQRAKIPRRKLVA